MERIKTNVSGLVKHFKNDSDDIEMVDTSGVVLKFAKNVGDPTVEWICNLIQKPVSSGGFEINMKKYEVDEESHCTQTFILTASLIEFFKAAEKYALLKKTLDGHLKPFIFKDCFDFENCQQDNESFFTCSEKQYLLMKMLDHVVCGDENVKSVVGYEKIKIYKGYPVLPRCVAYKILQIYPLHNYDELKPLKQKWYASLSSWVQPIENIKSYFGENIALYFYFLDFYTKYLIPPAVIGLCHYLFFVDENKADNVWFAILNLLWATIFLELWKRKSCYLIFDWGRLKSLKETSDLLEQPRAGYRGIPRISPITGQTETYYPTWRRRAKMYFLTYPALIASLLLAIVAMVIYLEFQQKVKRKFKDSSGLFVKVLVKMPNILYAMAIYCVNNIYGMIAVALNNWENHRVQSSYDNHLIIKLTLFFFINSFMSSFYIAFYLQDMIMLRQHLATLLIIQQLIQQVRESLIPYLKFKKHNFNFEKDGKKIQLKRLKDPKNQVIREGNMPTYDGTFQDYLEMVLQFGYVFMFSAVYPLAAFWALLNNITELKTDAFKLCKLHQRPFTVPASSIGAWQSVFEAMAILSVITNCGLIALSPTTQQWLSADTHPVTYVLMFVTVEHILIILKVAIQKAIPDVPGPITKEFAKMDFKAEQAISKKNETHVIITHL